ncbi:MAG: CotH kinase family protein [Bacteroidaceae bacterium]|nr:CotH kinase family protein [Bacteroidaceae bacterium]
MRSPLRRLLTVVALVLCCSSLLAQEPLPQPVFSQRHGLFTQGFSLRIECDAPGARIFYTTDGSLPSAQSTPYTKELDIRHTTVLRAVAVEGDSCSAVTTASYLFVDDILSQDNSPAGYPSEWGPYATISGNAQADYEMDPEIVSAERDDIVRGLLQLPVVSLATDKDHFFSNEKDGAKGGIYIYTGAPAGSGYGRGWERPVSFELFGGEEEHDLQVDCGVKLHGGHSRLPEKSPKHSLRLVFRDEFGPGKLHYPVFGTDEPKKFNALILRTAFCNSWHHQEGAQRAIAQYTRDMWARTVQKQMGWQSSNGQFAHVFLNGLYWGMYCISERIDDDFCDVHYWGAKDDFDVIKVEEYGAKHVVIAGNGTMDKWNEMLTLVDSVAWYIANGKHYNTSNRAYLRMQGLDARQQSDDTLEPLFDADNFIDYMIINQYGGNTDWDKHNWLAVRNRENPYMGFQFLCWDSEHILKSTDGNVLSYNNTGCPTDIFNKLITNKLFLRRYVDRVYRHCFNDGILTPSRAVAVWDSLYLRIDGALHCESARWGDYRRDVHRYNKSPYELYTVANQFAQERTRMLTEQFPLRTDAFIRQLRDKKWFPTTDAPTFELNGHDCYTRLSPAGDTLTTDDRLTLSAPAGIIYYTTDGTDPATWLGTSAGTTTPSAIRYDGEDIIAQIPTDGTPAVPFTLKAICLNGTDWSPLHECRFVLRSNEPDAIAAPARHDTPHVITDLFGRTIPASDPSQLPPGLYIIQGKKQIIR